MDYFDLAAAHGGVLARAFAAARDVRFCVFSFTSDWLYPTAESQEIVRALNAAGRGRASWRSTPIAAMTPFCWTSRCCGRRWGISGIGGAGLGRP